MKSLYSASACARPLAPPSRNQLSAYASFAFARYSLVSYVFIRVWSVRRPTSYFPRSISLIALSNRTLSGCCVSLVIGFSYFLRLKPHPVASATTSARTTSGTSRVLGKTDMFESLLIKRVPPKRLLRSVASPSRSGPDRHYGRHWTQPPTSRNPREQSPPRSLSKRHRRFQLQIATRVPLC